MTAAPAPVVLVVDDEPDSLNMMARIIEAAGFRVVRAQSADEARRVAQGTALDLIVSDVNMPGLRGPEMVKGLKADGVACPVLMVSGEGSYEALSESLHVPGANFLQKPFTPSDLTAAVFETLAPR
jgi:two-component system response regulator FixJ